MEKAAYGRMKPSFIAYVDESGDEGFVFSPAGTGSSRWFVLPAAVIRQTNDLKMVDCLKSVRNLLGKPLKTPCPARDSFGHEVGVITPRTTIPCSSVAGWRSSRGPT